MGNQPISVKELQEIELSILDAIDAVCQEHHIPYYLGEGSMLGAVRHQGFIPWDDDMDLLMMRDDYERFLQVAPTAMGEQYEVQHATTIEGYWSPFIKVRLLDTSRFAQKHIAHLTNHNGPYVDIFPIDNVPKQRSLRQDFQAFRIRLARCTLTTKLGCRLKRDKKWLIGKVCSPFVSIKRIHKILDRAFKACNAPGNAYAVNLGSYYNYVKQTMPIEWYGEPRWVPFDGRMAPIPAEAEKILTRIYGDYMTPPPDHKKLLKHNFVTGESEE